MLNLECALRREDHDCSKKDKERARSGLFYVQRKAKTNMFPIELSFSCVPFIPGHKQSEPHPAHTQTDKEADDFETEHAETLYRVDVHSRILSRKEPSTQHSTEGWPFVHP
jgi:hypothetical protein